MLTAQVNSRIWALEKERMAHDSASAETYMQHLRLRVAPAPAFSGPAASSAGGGPAGAAAPSVARMHTSVPRSAGPSGDPFVANSMAGAAGGGSEQQLQQQGFWRAMLAADPVAQVSRGPLWSDVGFSALCFRVQGCPLEERCWRRILWHR